MLVKESDTVALGCLYELVFGQNKLPKKINNLMNGTEKKLWPCQKEQSTETHESRQDSNADAGDHCLVFQNKPCRQ